MAGGARWLWGKVTADAAHVPDDRHARMFFVLHANSRPDGSVSMGFEELARRTGVSVGTARRFVAAALSVGYLERVARGTRAHGGAARVSLWRLTLPDPLPEPGALAKAVRMLHGPSRAGGSTAPP